MNNMKSFTKEEVKQIYELTALLNKGVITTDEYFEIAKEVLSDDGYYILYNFGTSAL